MEKIRRIRVVPKRYTFTDEAEAVAREMLDLHPATVHLYLSKRFGVTDERGLFGFYLNYKDVVFDFSSDGDETHVGIYVAPRYRQAAERKRVKMRNLIARQMNIDGKVFMEDGKLPCDLYFSVRQKNEAVYEKIVSEKGDTEEELRARMTEECRQLVGDKLDDGIMRYSAELKEVVRELFEDFKNTDVKGLTL